MKSGDQVMGYQPSVVSFNHMFFNSIRKEVVQLSLNLNSILVKVSGSFYFITT